MMKPTPTKGPSGFLGWKNVLKRNMFCDQDCSRSEASRRCRGFDERRKEDEMKVWVWCWCWEGWWNQPSLEKSKLKLGELMNIVGLELESSRVQLVKLKKEKKELTSELGWGKVVLDSMQTTIYKAESRLQGLLVAKSTINPTNLNKQNMICEFYKSIMEKTKFDHEEYYWNLTTFRTK